MNKFLKFFALILPFIALTNIISVESTGDNMLDIKNNLEEINERIYKLEEKLDKIISVLKLEEKLNGIISALETIKYNSKSICEKLDID